MPQVSVGLGGAAIDEDRAAFSQGSAPQRTLNGNITASQLIYSEGSWANYSIQQHSQSGREHLRDSVRLDVMYQVSVAYLNVLRSKMIEKVQKDNMKLTQANLDRAQTRLSIGVAGPDELYRWQTQFANDRQVVLKAESATFDAMQDLNRTINRPLSEEFVAEELDLQDALLIGGNRLFYDLFHKPNLFAKFREFALREGLEAAPELKALDEGILAQERLIAKEKRDYWLPTVSVEARVDQLFSDDGAGQRDSVANGMDDTEWSVGLYARLSLIEGGKKSADLAHSREMLKRLQTERKNTELRIGQLILQALNNTRASYPSISLSRMQQMLPGEIYGWSVIRMSRA